MKNLIQIIIFLTTAPSRCEFFTEPVIVKKDNISLFECWGVGLNETVWLMDETGSWYELEQRDQNSQLVIDALWEKLKPKQAVAA